MAVLGQEDKTGPDRLCRSGLSLARVEIDKNVLNDLSDNYWGTTDPEEISRWINDGYDEDNAGTQYIDFLPVADGPVPTEKKSLGSFRAMFR